MSVTKQIQVWPDKFRLGIKSLAGPHIDNNGKSFVPELGHPYSVAEALNKEHPSDAHMTLYSMVEKSGEVQPSIPLMTKHVLKQVRAEGADLVLNAIALDWDVPGHLPLTIELYKDFLTKFFEASAADERFADWTAIYTTRHGCRVVYELSEVVTVDDGEKYIISVIKEFKRHNIQFDQAARDWTRRFRLPKVLRDGLKTWEEPLFDMDIQDRTLDITKFKKSDLRSLVVATEYQRPNSIPTQEECHEVLYHLGVNSREVMTPYFKKAKALIKTATPYGDQLFDPEHRMAGDTGRNEAFQRMLGVIVPKLINTLKASPQQIFAVFDGPLDALEIIQGKQDPRTHFWNFLTDIYEREYALHQEREQEKADAVELGQSCLERMVEGMRQWCDNEALFSDDNTVREGFVRAHIFANATRFYYPMTKDGWYSTMCLSEKQLIPYIRESYLKDIIETNKTDMRGDNASVSAIEIVNNHSTVVHEVRMSPLQGVNGRIDHVRDTPILTLPMYQRNDFIPAVNHPDVDGWLRALVGSQYPLLAKWIGYALDFEGGPICALSLVGEGDAGKKVLVAGLSECLADPCLATGHDMTGSENGAILRTPFLVVNEGMPKARDMSPSDTFKALTAGDPIRVREMYKPSVNVLNPMRLIFTANDHDVLQSISKGKVLSPQTRKALGERLLHFDIGQDAVTYLKRLGGMAYTAKEGRRWIRGDGDQPSDYIVAQHFMYLYKNRPPRNPSDRYCVMGNCNESDSFQIASQSEHLPMVMRGIINLSEGKAAQLRQHVVITKAGGVFVTVQGVFAQIKDVNQEHVSERAMDGVLKSLMKDSQMYEMNGLYYRRLDPAAIIDWAKPNGYPCPVIEQAWERSKKELP